MRILTHCALPFALTHGGQQIQIEQTVAALQSIGIHVEPLRWWDASQKGDIIHYFGRMPAAQIEMARKNGMKVVMAELLTATGSRTPAQLFLQKTVSRAVKALAPRQFVTPFNWNAYCMADASIGNTPWEAHLMRYLFDAPADRIHVIPNGVEEAFLQSKAVGRGRWLICTATITERKRVLELAHAAAHAKTPLWIIGKAYAESDPYARAFFNLCKQHPDTVRFEGPIADRNVLAKTYREARGFVLLSTMETRSLSAEEAAACECPLLLSDLPWARTVFQNDAWYCPLGTDASTASVLRKFYDAAPQMKPPAKPLTWVEVARQLVTVYERVLSTSR